MSDDIKVIPLRITPATRAAAPRALVAPQQVGATGPAVRPSMGVTVHQPDAARIVSPTEVLPPGTAAPPFAPWAQRPGPPRARLLHTPESDYEGGVPLFQYASVTLNPSDDSPVNNAALVNPSDLPVEIAEVRFNLSSSVPFVNLGSVGVRLSLGSFPVTKDFCPLFNLDSAENLFFGESNPNVSMVVDPDATKNGSFAAFRWRPRSRLYLPPRSLMSVQFSHFGLNPVPIVADVGYAGRVLTIGQRPAESIVPYAASWVAPGINMYGFNFGAGQYRFQTPVVESSTEQDLVNQAESAVLIRKITGRFLFFNGNNSFFSDEANQVLDQMVFVRLRTSRGYRITKDFVPFRLLFGRDTRAMETDVVLETGEYVVADVQFTAGNLSGVAADDPTISPLAVTISPAIALVGERSVPL